jgi:hypothetical protein
MTKGRVATHVAAAVVGGTITLLSVKTCGTSADDAPQASTSVHRTGTPAASASAPPRDAGAVRSIPVITRFNVPNAAVNVTQRENGTLEVVNSDPKLTGTQLAIEGITADGKLLTFDVRVPAPRLGP